LFHEGRGRAWEWQSGKDLDCNLRGVIHEVFSLQLTFNYGQFNNNLPATGALVMRDYHPKKDMMGFLSFDGKGRFDGLPRSAVVLAALLIGLLTVPANRLAAQSAANDARSDGNDARADAMFATPGGTPAPLTNLFATTPGLEQQARRSQFTFNILAPIFFNSNAEAANTGGTPSAEISPIVGLSWSSPFFQSPFRISANFRAEVDRFTQASSVDFDKLAGSLRLQYVDATNDQAFSPYFAYAPRMDFDPTFRERFATRHDLNLGFNKIFNFDGNFQRVPFASNTLEATVWSFGLTSFVQRRFRDPEPSSIAFFLIPSATYVISENWNFSLGLDFERRWFDPVQGFAQQDWFLEPIATLEFVLPSSWFGAAGNAALFGRPALDFQVAYENNWSNVQAATYNVWHVGGALKLGWRF
jgi:hypothetical protein